MKHSGYKLIAQRYVKALFDVAQETKAMNAVEKDFTALASLFSTDDTFEKMAANPLLTRTQQASIAEGLLTSMGAHTLTSTFVALLARQKRLPVLPEAIALFMEEAAQLRGEVTAEVASANALPAAHVENIASRLSDIVGQKVMVRASVNPALLAGLIIRIGSRQLDGSVAGKLERLGQKLKTA